MINGVKPFLVLGHLVADYERVVSRVSTLESLIPLAMYLVLFTILCAALLLTAYIANTVLRLSCAIPFTIASIFQQSVERSTGGTMTYETFLNMYNARGSIADAMAQHGHVLWVTVPVGLILLLGLALPPRTSRLMRLPRWSPVLAPTAALLILGVIYYKRGGEGSAALPAAFTPLAYSALMAAETLIVDQGPRHDVAIPRSREAMARDIILIVDESVAGNYLDINHRDGVRSGLKSTPSRVQVFNYGRAVSIHTCSATANAVLRFGGTRETYQTMLTQQPSIWRYAHRAALRTVYLDGQANGGVLQNLMTQAERSEIDDFVQFEQPPLYRDMAIADELAARIENGVPEFIYVNKIGAHFPIADKYPESFRRYNPVLPRGQQDAVTWTSDRTGFNGTPGEWVRYRNAYRNTLLWNVGGFFDRLVRQTRFRGVTVIYTSDHGQDLHERGNPGRNTHCGTTTPFPEEGVVPLVVLQGTDQSPDEWRRSAALNHDRVSAFRIFPTILGLMGYQRGAVEKMYGPALGQGGTDDFSFIRRFYTHLGLKPDYMQVDLKQVAAPPTTDYRASASSDTAMARRKAGG